MEFDFQKCHAPRTAYNIRPEEASPGMKVYSTQDDLEPLTYEESSEVAGAVDRVIFEYLKRKERWFNEVYDLVYGRSSLFWELGDRTVEFRLEDIRLLTPALIRKLQTGALGAYPLWRVRRVDEFEEDDVVIYPRDVVFGRKLALSMEQDWSVWQKDALERWEKKNGSRKRQIDWLLSQAPRLVRELGTAPFVIAGCFAGEKRSRLTLWTLQKEPSHELALVTKPPNAGVIRDLAIDAKGKFDPRVELAVREYREISPAFHLYAWNVKKAKSQVIAMKRRASGKVWEQELREGDVMPDDTLQT